MQEVASKGRIVEDVVQALRNEEAAKLAAQRDAQTARQRVHQLEVCPSFCWPASLPTAVYLTYHPDGANPSMLRAAPCFPLPPFPYHSHDDTASS